MTPPDPAVSTRTAHPTARRLHLAVDLDGHGAHPGAWRTAERPPGHLASPRALRAAVAAAESAGFALATFQDAPTAPRGPGARLEAGVRAAHVAVVTDRLGLAPELQVATTEPFHLATQLASLDHASRGRAAWLVGAAADDDALATTGAPPRAREELRREAADVIDVARLLWDSWQDDAVVRDAASGRYLDPGRVRHVDFEGATFTIKGPLITPRPPQGQVVVVVPDHLDLDDRADVVLVTSGALDGVAGVAGRAARARASGAPLVVVDVEVALDTEGVPALDRLVQLDEDEPWAGTGRLRHVGSAAGLVELLVELSGVVDGVRLLPAVHAVDLPVVVGEVLPELARSGLHRPAPPGSTLRRTLGLPRPEHRSAATEVPA